MNYRFNYIFIRLRTKCTLILIAALVTVSVLVGCDDPDDLDATIVLDTPETNSSEPSPISNPQELAYCWHGRSGFEFLVVYRKSQLELGLNLSNLIRQRPWDNGIEDILNDSLKMCFIDSIWRGETDPNSWFPKVSYLQYINGNVLACENSPGCGGEFWTIPILNSLPPMEILQLLGSSVEEIPSVIGFYPTR